MVLRHVLRVNEISTECLMLVTDLKWIVRKLWEIVAAMLGDLEC